MTTTISKTSNNNHFVQSHPVASTRSGPHDDQPKRKHDRSRTVQSPRTPAQLSSMHDTPSGIAAAVASAVAAAGQPDGVDCGTSSDNHEHEHNCGPSHHARLDQRHASKTDETPRWTVDRSVARWRCTSTSTTASTISTRSLSGSPTRTRKHPT